MGNARWLGVPLRDVQARAEPKASARQVTLDGLDVVVFGGGDFVTSLDVHPAMDGEVILACRMNGADISMLNAYPVKLVVSSYFGGVQLKASSLPGYAKAQASCVACHSAEYMLYQPATAPRPYWDAMVSRMKMVFRAPIDDADIPVIVDDLVKTYGSEQPK